MVFDIKSLLLVVWRLFLFFMINRPEGAFSVTRDSFSLPPLTHTMGNRFSDRQKRVEAVKRARHRPKDHSLWRHSQIDTWKNILKPIHTQFLKSGNGCLWYIRMLAFYWALNSKEGFSRKDPLTSNDSQPDVSFFLFF